MHGLNEISQVKWTGVVECLLNNYWVCLMDGCFSRIQKNAFFKINLLLH